MVIRSRWQLATARWIISMFAAQAGAHLLLAIKSLYCRVKHR